MLERLIGENIQLYTSVRKEKIQVCTDPGQMEQVIMNLVLNARDAMPDGGILTIRTTLYQDDAHAHSGSRESPPGEPVWGEPPPGKYALLAVSDTGSGIDPDTQEHMFEPFYTTKEIGKGTGLGLSTVYGIVNQNDGHIGVSSNPGEGTTFTVYLPVVRRGEERSCS
jgi:signal transduction histidine kinase